MPTYLKTNTDVRNTDAPKGAVWVGILIGGICIVLVVLGLVWFEYTTKSK